MSSAACELTYQYTGGRISGYCVTCPEQSEIVAVPERVELDPLPGWNAGARSVARIATDCYVAFSMTPPFAGVICGLSRNAVDRAPQSHDFGFYAYADSGEYRYVVSERGVPRTPPVTFAPSITTFRIERRQSRVDYFVDDILVYRSTVRSTGGLYTVGLLYRAGDGID